MTSTRIVECFHGNKIGQKKFLERFILITVKHFLQAMIFWLVQLSTISVFEKSLKSHPTRKFVLDTHPITFIEWKIANLCNKCNFPLFRSQIGRVLRHLTLRKHFTAITTFSYQNRFPLNGTHLKQQAEVWDENTFHLCHERRRFRSLNAFLSAHFNGAAFFANNRWES